ncbi:hypothetical protein SAMN06273567_106162 [Geodermatophilus aquaeductus]|uniref:Uncharacterized protein n=2 Tax=Geodermatophilus aquaeductus TaxID=1564161 RepID=A0A521F0N3_9ACTN|nr:hypothetical protein SAMN06273567_106162 [Geodermatophilus aquaeductus]
MAERFGKLGQEQRQGHVFEWMHELSYNLKAVAQDEEARLRVTTWLGEPHAAADLRVYGASGDVLSEVQAKVVSGAARRLAPTDGLSAHKYEGMQLLVPSDHLTGTQELIDQRLGMPEGPFHARYADVRERLTDRIVSGEVSSTPVSTSDVAGAACDPQAYLQSLIRSQQLRDIARAGGAAALTAGLTTGLVEVATSYVQAGTREGIPWPEVARRAAQSALKAGTIACLSEGIAGAAQHAAEAGAGSWVGAVVEGGFDHVLGRAVFGLAGIAHGVATGRLTADAAAWAAAETLTKGVAGWACAAVGQAVIPVPIVGAVIGQVVGQYGAVMLVQGLRMAVTARDRSAAWDAEYEALLRHTAEVQAAAAEELREVEAALAAYDVGFRRLVLPRLDAIQAALGTGRPDDVLADLADLTHTYLGTPVFASIAEFDALMQDRDFTLVLDLGGV